jgi:hypothetical protein
MTASEISNLISAISKLAWPVAILVLAIVFRRTIVQQIGRMKTFKTPGTEITFAERVDEAVRQSGKVIDSLAVQVASERQAHLTRLASSDPRRAIRSAWDMVREAAQDAARRRNLEWTNTRGLAERLGQDGVLSGDVVNLIRNLRNLRYDMANGENEDITSTTATAYVSAASNAADVLLAVPTREASPGDGARDPAATVG